MLHVHSKRVHFVLKLATWRGQSHYIAVLPIYRELGILFGTPLVVRWDCYDLLHSNAYDFSSHTGNFSFWNALNIFRHSSLKVLFSYTIVSLNIFSSQMRNSVQMCCLVFKLIFLVTRTALFHTHRFFTSSLSHSIHHTTFVCCWRI